MNPYQNLESRAFWRQAIADRNSLEISELYRAKFSLGKTEKVITAGSCFAQHIGRALKNNGFNWFDAEPAPSSPSLSTATAKKFGYGVFSFRTGNIYTTALLRQWITWSLAPEKVSQEVWASKDGRFYDPFRPAIEPGGFASRSELMAARVLTLEAIRTAIQEASVFVFTLGLTEGWVNAATGVAYPMCPGTLAGEFDAEQHSFRNYKYPEIAEDLAWVIKTCKAINPDIRFLLTVSPVPLTATASGKHVLPATVYSKSTLRAVAGDLADTFDFVDYFPSYEIISSAPYRGMFYLPNQREVSLKGVEHVMTHFFAGLGITAPVAHQAQAPVATSKPRKVRRQSEDDLACEEAMLEAFGR